MIRFGKEDDLNRQLRLMNFPRFSLSRFGMKNEARRDGTPYDFQIKTHERPKSVADRIKGLYQEAKAHRSPDVFTEDIRVDDNRLFSVVNHLQGINLNATELGRKRGCL